MTYPKEPVKEDKTVTSEKRETTTTAAIDPNVQQKIESLKNFAASIRDVSASIRDTMRTLRESGAIDEIIAAVHETTITTRDTMMEVSKISRDLKERGMIRNTAKTLDETITAANEAAESFKQTVEEAKAAAPQTAEVIKKAKERVKTKKENR